MCRVAGNLWDVHESSWNLKTNVWFSCFFLEQMLNWSSWTSWTFIQPSRTSNSVKVPTSGKSMFESSRKHQPIYVTGGTSTSKPGESWVESFHPCPLHRFPTTQGCLRNPEPVGMTCLWQRTIVDLQATIQHVAMYFYIKNSQRQRNWRLKSRRHVSVEPTELHVYAI